MRNQHTLLQAFLSWLRDVRWTIGLTMLMLFANYSLLANAPPFATRVVVLLEYDRDAICHGELWRLATGNLVHWSAEHLWLDMGAFLVLGVLYEPSFKRPIIPFWAFFVSVSFFIGATLFVLVPDMNLYRGLSGVDSGIFAAALLIETANARQDVRRWLFVGPAAMIFTSKLVFECWTGEMFFATTSLGNLGQPIPLAHVAGAMAALFLFPVTNKAFSEQLCVQYARQDRML